MSDLTPIRPDQIAVSHRFDVCDGKGDSIAHVVVHERAGALWLSDLWVHPDHRRRGIARLLITLAERLAIHRPGRQSGGAGELLR